MELGFIGFGEASQNFAEGFLQNDVESVYVYDVNHKKAVETAALFEKYDCIHVCPSINDVIDLVENIFIAVPGGADETVFGEITKSTFTGKLFIDICTAKPGIKYLNCQKINGMGGGIENSYVDAAVMGSIPKLKHMVPIIASGDGAQRFYNTFSALGMNIQIHKGKAGEASTIKLCRSIYMKGIAALLIETQEVSRLYGVEAEVFASIAESMNADSFEVYSERLIKGTYKHCVRRMHELEDSMNLIEDGGLCGDMTKASIHVYENILDRQKQCD